MSEIEYLCKTVDPPKAVSNVPGSDAYEMRVCFELTPSKYWDKPEEKQHRESEEVRVWISGPKVTFWRLKPDLLVLVVRWYAWKALERGETEVRLPEDDSGECPVDPAKIKLPKEPFTIFRPGRKIGF